MINKVTLVGNVGADPEVRRLESGVAVARLGIATNESYKDKSGNWQDQTEWHDVVLWRQLAERAETQLRKGMLIYVEGKLSTSKFQDKNGIDRRRTEVIASYIRIMNKREDSRASDGGGSSYSPQQQTEKQDEKQSDDSGDDLPF